MKPCRECQKEISEQATACPSCGAPFPARPEWNGWGYEYKSRLELCGLPLVHISFKYRPNRMPVPARGIIAIGQFGAGVITVAQFGIGFVCVGQFCIGAWVLAQFAAAWACIAQIGICVQAGYGQAILQLSRVLGN